MNTTMPLPAALNEPSNIAAFLRDIRRLRAEAA